MLHNTFSCDLEEQSFWTQRTFFHNEKPGESYGKLWKSTNTRTMISMGVVGVSLGLFFKGGENTVEINTIISALSWGSWRGLGGRCQKHMDISQVNSKRY